MKSLGLKVKSVKHSINRLPLVELPAMIWCSNGNHMILAKIDNNQYLLQDLSSNKPLIVDEAGFKEIYEGELILVTSRASAVGKLAKFDFTWFIPAVVKYRKVLLEVLVVSVVIQLFALITPLFFQIVMDKVLVHRGFSTLDVIAVAFFVVTIFEVTLGGLRTFIFSHTTSRIDVELGARLFRHLLSLPQAYFESHRVGETVARMRELEQIREFLTGQALTSVLDLCFSFIFILVMWFYSPQLTIVVLISLPCYALWSATISPMLRARLNTKFARNADNQSFLVESITAMGTVKAMAVEPQMTKRWDQQLAAYVQAGFKVMSLANIGQQGVPVYSKNGHYCDIVVRCSLSH